MSVYGQIIALCDTNNSLERKYILCLNFILSSVNIFLVFFLLLLLLSLFFVFFNYSQTRSGVYSIDGLMNSLMEI